MTDVAGDVKEADEQQDAATGEKGASGLKVEGAPPPLYKSLSVLEADKHGDLALAERMNFAFLRGAQTIPLTAEEIPIAQRFFPVIFSEGEVATPLAVLAARGYDAYLQGDGAWRGDVYIPAYLRRMPFALAKFEGDSNKRALCADLGSPRLVPADEAAEERRLFQDGAPTKLAQDVIKACEEFDVAAARTETLCRRLSNLGVFERRSIQVATPDGMREFRGLVVVSEARLWKLDDATLAGLARTGALSITAAHLMSIANFRTSQPPPAT